MNKLNCHLGHGGITQSALNTDIILPKRFKKSCQQIAEVPLIILFKAFQQSRKQPARKKTPLN